MDLKEITDVNQLKALAYDEVVAQTQAHAAIEQANKNIQMIEQRIAQIQAEATPAKEKAKE